jgi:hypothetical protein
MASIDNGIPQEHMDMLTKTGVTITHEGRYRSGVKCKTVAFWVCGFNIGHQYCFYNYEKDVYTPKSIDTYEYRIDTRVLMNVGYKFTKSNAKPTIDIITKFRKTFEQNDIKHVCEWLKIMCIWLKTALAKKRKIEADVDFEQ